MQTERKFKPCNYSEEEIQKVMEVTGLDKFQS